jgi:hypothetical protein
LIGINAHDAGPEKMQRFNGRRWRMSTGRGQRARRNVVCSLVAAALGMSGAVTSAAAKEPWEQVLSQQLDLEQKCVLTGTYNVQEWPLGSEMVLSGKARCYDGREFDFSQRKNHLKFDIKACEPAVC